MNRSYPAEDQPSDIFQKIRCYKLDGTDQPGKGADHHPESRCDTKSLGGVIFRLQ